MTELGGYVLVVEGRRGRRETILGLKGRVEGGREIPVTMTS